MAQNYGKGEYRSGCIGVIISHRDGRKPSRKELKAAQREAEEKARLAWESAVPMGGNRGDIYGFTLGLGIGDITEDVPGARRKAELDRLFSLYPREEGEDQAQDLLQRTKERLDSVLSRAAAGEAVRIWYSDMPDELCGLYWLMAQLCRLEQPHGDVFLVKLPEWEARADGTVVQKSGWGEVSPGEWGWYQALQTLMPSTLCSHYAARWRALQAENAPLRAVLNRQLVSMPEDLYDGFIKREIATEPDEFHEAEIIGRVLGKYQLGIGDAWIAHRIEAMIRAGALEAVTCAAEDEPQYRRILKKCAAQK